MSIIEKAMKKLNGAPEKTGRASAEKHPNVVSHPTATQAPTQEQAARHIATPPRPSAPPVTTRATAPTRISESRPPVARTERPIARLQPEGIQALDYQTTSVAEELRRIKRPLLANAYGKSVIRVERGNLIMLTSSLPGEGKSRMALNLAYSMGLERNHSVLLIDADTAKAQISRMYGLERAPGFTDVLLKRTGDLDDVMLRTETPDVNVVPAGRRHVQATELLGSDEMEQLVISLAQADPSRIVIFDCPPLLATNEPQLMSRLVGQVVVVVEAGRTPHHIVKEAISMLDPAKAIGLVLNKSQNSFGGDYYGYSYGGYYGYAEHDRGSTRGNAGE